MHSVGVPEPNPRSQLRSTNYCRLFAEASTPEPLIGLLNVFKDIALRHFSGFHSSLDMRTAIPRPFLAYYPSLYAQDNLEESVVLLEPTGEQTTNGNGTNGNNSQFTKTEIQAGHPPAYEPLERRDDYDSLQHELSSFGATQQMRLGDVALARSGDKGSNLNCGIFVETPKQWEWLRTFLSRERMIQLIGEEDWREEFHLERVEFPNIFAVHFVIYGILGRGVSGSSRLDSLGKAFADYIRDKVVDVPVAVLE
jgi:hypothetical protein